MHTLREAVLAITAAFHPLEAERVPLLEARGRFLAADLEAVEDAPYADQSAMDGYAVHAEDVARAGRGAEVTLPVVAESRAGGPLPPPLARGTACRIFTGARLPEGATAVVIQEDCARDADRVAVGFAAKRWHHVRRRGSDVARGDRLLVRGAEIRAPEIALLASQGIATIGVVRRPRVAILSTGDELVELGEPRREGTITSSNAWALAAAVLDAGGAPWILPIARDDLATVRDRIVAALGADVVITTGGVSVGDHDVTRDAMAAAGVALDFWKVRMKPGKPVAFGVAQGTPVIGLPGNPVSAQVTFDVLVRPGLRVMLGDPRPHPHLVTVELGHEHVHSTGRIELARARFERRGDVLVAFVAQKQGSASLSGFAALDGYVLLDAERERFAEGTRLRALPVRNVEGTATTELD